MATRGGFTDYRTQAYEGPAPFSSVDPAPAADPQAATLPGVRALTTYEAADHLSRGKGQVTVAILYATRCPRSRAMFPGFVALAGRYQGQRVQVAAFAVDHQPEDVLDFLARYRAPFDPVSVRPWERGQMSGALGPLGFHIRAGATFNMPYVAVLGRDGHVRTQWDAATNIAAIEQAVRAELAR